MNHPHDSVYERVTVVLDASSSRYLIGLCAHTTKINQSMALDPSLVKGEDLLHIVQLMLSTVNAHPKAIKLWITTRGPGSFTGLRVVMSALKSIGAVWACPIVSIPTLYALASITDLADGSPVVMKARKGLYYLYRKGDPAMDYQTVTLPEVMDQTRNSPVIGWEGRIPQSIDDRKSAVRSIQLTADHLMDLGLGCFSKNTFLSDVYTLIPDYAGASVAEIRHRNSKRVGGQS
jgi:tRNA A37 threonylcarbamoyladenosine modification protein TsaB